MVELREIRWTDKVTRRCYEESARIRPFWPLFSTKANWIEKRLLHDAIKEKIQAREETRRKNADIKEERNRELKNEVHGRERMFCEINVVNKCHDAFKSWTIIWAENHTYRIFKKIW